MIRTQLSNIRGRATAAWILLRETNFDSVDELKEELLQYLYYYNSERPHQALNGKTPVEFAKNCPRIT